MKKFEITTAIIAIIALGMKLLHIPGATILMLLSFLALATFYYLFSFALLNTIPLGDIFKKEAYKETNWKRIVGAVVTGFALSEVLGGMLFKFLHLPGASIMLLVGVGTLCIVAIIAIIQYLRTHSQFYAGVLVRTAIIGGLGLSLLLLSTFQEMPYNIEKQEFSEAMGLSNYENGAVIENESVVEYNAVCQEEEEYEKPRH